MEGSKMDDTVLLERDLRITETNANFTEILGE